MAAASSISSSSSSFTSLAKSPNPSTPSTTSRILNLIPTPPLPHHPHLNKRTISLKPPSFSSFITKSSKPFSPHLKPTSIKALFTGIVEEIGQIKNIGYENPESFTMTIQAKTILEDVHLGDSISVNGTCLTVTEFSKELSEFSVGLAPETLRKTSLAELEQGSVVNLERALLASTRMGGHFVQGHVDGTGEIVGRDVEGDSLWIKVKVGKGLLKYIVPKGYITVDGTSLTVVDVLEDEGCFSFMLVAYTQQHVVIPTKKIGQKVNLEVDILGKYVERLLSSGFLENIKSS